MKILGIVLASCGVLFAIFIFLVWFLNDHPRDVQKQEISCRDEIPVLKPNQKIKILNWNVQFMAGKNYTFYFDLPHNSGPHERPSPQDIALTLKEVVRVILAEKPDVILLQEVDEGAKRTDFEDQLKRLEQMLPPEYHCSVSAFYWRSKFVPHPRIRGAVGLKLGILSKYKISEATRHQLPIIPQDPITKQFYLKRAVLEIRLPVKDRKDLVIMNTHLDAFAQGTDTMEKQVKKVEQMLTTWTDKGHPWIIAGDFNLLPPGKPYSTLGDGQRYYYKDPTEIERLFSRFAVVPTRDEANGPQAEKWHTYFSNDPSVKTPDRTIDYIFYSRQLRLLHHEVRQHDTAKISDHFPVIAEFEIDN